MIPAWRDEAACLGMDTEMFFDKEKHQGKRGVFAPSPATERALKTCRSYPVRVECLEDELQYSDQHGVRGGYTARDRSRMNGRVVS